jgi:hypothetical protein
MTRGRECRISGWGEIKSTEGADIRGFSLREEDFNTLERTKAENQPKASNVRRIRGEV